MAAIYQADVFCDGCAAEIRDRICSELWERRDLAECPDGTDVSEFADRDDLYDHLIFMDERYYDSDEFPKHCSDDEESDCPQHCGSLGDCVSAEELPDGTKVGYFFGNSLTSDGDDYVRDAVSEDRANGDTGSVACLLWAPCYDYIDYGPEEQCAVCGDYADLDENDECENCADSEEGALWSTNPGKAGDAICAFQGSDYADEGDAHYEADVHFEHGQLWIVCPCGASWSVVDCEDSGERYFGFERVDVGDEDYHCEDSSDPGPCADCMPLDGCAGCPVAVDGSGDYYNQPHTD